MQLELYREPNKIKKMSYFILRNKIQKVIEKSVLLIVICITISFFIEVSKSYLPDRTSSLVDIGINGLGACIGVLYCVLESNLSSLKNSII